MKLTWKTLLFPFVSLAIAAADIWSKLAILSGFELYQSKNIVGDLLRFTFTWNRGITFGTFNSSGGVPEWQPYLLIGINFLILIAMVILFFRLQNILKPGAPLFLGRLVVSFVAGGAIGNNTDRFMHKAVLDFIDVGIGNNRFYIFNVADSFIVVGAIGLALLLIFFEQKQQPKVES